MTTKYISPVANNQQFDNMGNMLSGGTITVYNANTLTLASIFANSSGGALANPVTLNSSGRIPNGDLYLDSGVSYDIVIRTGSTVLESYSGVTVATGGSGGTDYQPQIDDLQDQIDDIVAGGTTGVTTATLAASDGSNLIGYINTGAGAVARKVQDVLRESVSVRDFGAKGDGTTDDTAAINAALVAGAGKTVYFPTGNYIITNTLTIRSNTRMLGAGSEKTTITLSPSFPAGADALVNQTITGTVNVYYDRHIAVQGITFDGNNNSTRTASLISLFKVDRAEIAECSFVDHTYICVAILASRDVNVHNNRFENNGRPKPNTVSAPCVWTDYNAAYGYPVDISVEHNTFINNKWSCSYFMPQGGSFSYNYCLNNGESGVFTNSNGAWIRYIGNHIQGQTRTNISASGIETAGSYLVISDNIILDNASDGISLTDTENVVVSGNQIFMNGQEPTYFTGASGIAIITYSGPNPDHIRISHNRIGDRQTTKTQVYGISVSGPGAPAERVAIHDNDLTEQKLGDISVSTGKWVETSCYAQNNYLIDGSITLAAGGTSGPASDVAGGSSNQILYQAGTGNTDFITAPSTADTYLSWNGSSFVWNAVSGGTTGGVTLDTTQVITGEKTFTNANNQFLALTYATSNGSTGQNAFFAEDSQYALIGGTNGVTLASGAPYPGTARYAAEAGAFRPVTNIANNLGTSAQRWATVYSQDINLSGSVASGTWNGSTIGVAKGGTGVTTTPTNGQLLIGNGTGYSVGNLTAGSGVTITNSAGGITISSSGGTSGVTLDTTQTITGTKSFTSNNNQYTGITYVTSDGGTGQNGFLSENSAYAVVGGANGVTLATGAYPGTGRYAAESGAFRPVTNAANNLGTTSQRWATIYGTTLNLSGTVSAGTWNGATIGVAYGGTGATTLTGAGIVTTGDAQTITGAKTMNSSSNLFTGSSYRTAAAIFTEDTGLAKIGGTSGVVLASGSTGATGLAVADSASFRPFSDNSKSSGTASQRWSVVYSATGTINTSDANEKTQVREINEVEQLVAARVRKLFRAFKWRASVEEKGSGGARIHWGIIAQELAAAFAAEGLDAADYGMFCSDTWTDESGRTTTRMGVRYEELLCFMMANMG